LPERFSACQVVDEDGKFREDNFSEAMAVLANKGDDGGGGAKRKSGAGQRNGGETDCFKIVKMIMERNFAPVIVFSFSKKECEAYALQMSKLDFNTRESNDLVAPHVYAFYKIKAIIELLLSFSTAFFISSMQ
jgi:ATP-dependent RNA helicase DOB1